MSNSIFELKDTIVGNWMKVSSASNLSSLFAPDTPLTLSADPAGFMANNVITEVIDWDTTFTGTSGNDTFFFQAAYYSFDAVAYIYAGAGNDNIIFDDQLNYTIDTGTGNDAIFMSGIGVGLDNWVDLFHDGLTSGITVNINGATNSGQILKPGGETTVLIDVQHAMDASRLSVFGTEHADTFNISVSENGWLRVQGEEGNDTINISGGNGTIRVSYRNADAGIVADLTAGIVQDGLGGTDTITGIGNSDNFQLYGTDHSDLILGSAADEEFFLHRGNDTLDGGAGFDMVRYDTSVPTVTVDLAAGTATGSNRRFTISDQLRNIEAALGSAGDDQLLGNSGGNRLLGEWGNDYLFGRGGDDTLEGGAGNDTIDGGSGYDRVDYLDVQYSSATITQLSPHQIQVTSDLGSDVLTGVEEIAFADQIIRVSDWFPVDGEIVGSSFGDTLDSGNDAENIITGGGNDRVDAGGGNDTIDGGSGHDMLIGGEGDDLIEGGDGIDTLNGGAGDDTILGGSSQDDLRDVVYAGAGNDSIDGGYGNDLIYGQDGNDHIIGGFGVDELRGQGGDDVISGGAFSDLIFGGQGDDFISGGYGHDRINGGSGADRFYHLGIANHGSDWIQDYSAAEGDVLLFGNSSASVDDFQVNMSNTGNAGDSSVDEAFVIYRPTGQIIWALVDGGGQDEINLRIGGEVFDLLA